jgi:hypothetical protein
MSASSSSKAVTGLRSTEEGRSGKEDKDKALSLKPVDANSCGKSGSTSALPPPPPPPAFLKRTSFYPKLKKTKPPRGQETPIKQQNTHLDR